MTTPTAVAEPKVSKWPVFLRRGRIGGFLTVVLAGQIVYSSFEAFKGSLILPLTEALGITNEQYGFLWTWIGISMFLYIPAGWINNRFPIRNILIAWAGWRLITFMILYLAPINFTGMIIIAATWGVWDAIGWPAVVNGVSYMSKDANTKGRGLAMGLLESIRRGAEFIMNSIIIALIAIFPQNTSQIMIGFGVGYALLLIPLILALLKFVPINAIAHDDGVSDNIAALKGLWRVITLPRVWLAGLAGLAVYWAYVNLFWSSAPYLKLVYDLTDAQAAMFGIFNTAALGILAGLVAGVLADYVFKSSTTMIAVALVVITVAAAVVRLLPDSPAMLWPAMILLIIMAFGVFLGKSVILAPIAELHLPESINGSAMAVGSFLVYASIFWANPWNGRLLDQHKGQEYLAYQQVFTITMVVAAVGAACAIALIFLNKRAAATDDAAFAASRATSNEEIAQAGSESE